MLMLILALFTALLVVFTFITLSRAEVWWVRGWDFPRFQLGIFALILLAVDIALLDFTQVSAWILSGITLLALVYQAWWIIPYTLFFPVEVKAAVANDPDNTIAILASNVLTPNRNSAALVALVREHRPDILVTLETDAWWQTQLDVLGEDYPYTIKCPLDNLYGMHVYSKLPLHDAAIQFLVETDIPSMHAAVQLRSGKKIRLHFLHPAPPSPTENEESGERDAELLVIAKTVAETNVPVIVAGDLNDVAWSATTRLFRKISGMLDPRVGRGMFNSFHADYPFIRWPLDHLFHSQHFLLVDIQRLPSIGSDHFPMFIKLAYHPELGVTQEGLESTNEEEQWADEKIASQSARDVHQPGA